MTLDDMKQKADSYTRLSPIANANMTRPHVETNYSAKALGSRSSDSVKRVGLVGSADDGMPGVVYKISNLMEAKRIFGGGDIVEAANMVWNPNKKLNQGGGDIYAMRIEDAKSATLVKDGLTFTSKVYGVQSNQTKLSFAKNPISNAYKLTVDYAPTHYHQVYDNLGQLFKLQYLGTEGYKIDKATYTVVRDASGNAQTFQVDIDESPKEAAGSGSNASAGSNVGSGSSAAPGSNTSSGSSAGKGTGSNTDKGSGSNTDKGGANAAAGGTSGTGSNAQTPGTSTPGAQDLTREAAATPLPPIHIHQVFDLTTTANYKLYSLMKQLSAIPNLKVQLLLHGDNVRMTSSILDAATDVDMTGDINDPLKCTYVWGVQGDIVDKLSEDGIITVSADYTKPVPEPFEAAMSGGSTGNTPLSWSEHLQVFAKAPIYYLVPLTSSAAVHQEVKEFVNQQSAATHPMRAYVGGGFNEGVGNSISRQLELKNPRVDLVVTSGVFETYDGVKLHVPAFLVAALAAGVQSSLELGGDLTNKYVNMVSLDQDFDSNDLDTLYNNGIIAVESITNRGEAAGFRFVSGVTTYNSTNEEDEDAIVKNRTGLGELTDFLFDDLRKDLEEKFIGQKLSEASADLLKSEVSSFLLRQKLAPNRSVVDYDDNSIEVIVDGTTAYISFAIIPALTLDYIKVYGAYNRFQAASANSGSALSGNTPSSNVLYGGYDDIPRLNGNNF